MAAERRHKQRFAVCVAAFACTDYLQGASQNVGARGAGAARTTMVNREVAPSQRDPYSLYVQLSQYSLDDIMLLSEARER